MKQCTKCKEVKPLEEFYNERRYSSGKTSACKVCIYEGQKKYRDKSYFMTTHHNKSSECRRKNIEYNLDAEFLKEIWTGFCPVFGYKLTPRKGRELRSCPNLDRIDPTKGYTKGNVVWLSRKANLIKSDATLEEIKKVVRYLEKFDRKDTH